MSKAMAQGPMTAPPSDSHTDADRTEHPVDRRSFLKNSALVGGATLGASLFFPAPPMQAQEPGRSDDTPVRKPMRRIALEEHFIMNEPEHIDRLVPIAPGVPPGPAALKALMDVGDGRLEAMAKAGIDFAVLSDAGIVQSVLDPTIAMRLAQQSNDFLAGVVQKHPKHFAGFAAVPLEDPAKGADEFARAITQLGFKGALIYGQTNGHYLDEDRYSVFWERVQALNVPIYLHISEPVVEPVTYVGCPALVGPVFSWTAETAAHALRLILNGTFSKYPNVQLILGHMGETLPYLLWRIDDRMKALQPLETDRMKTLMPQNAPLPSEVFKKNIVITTSGVFANQPLLCALAEIGDDSVLYSTDYPFESMPEAAAWFDKAPISQQTREKISWRNAARILKL